MKLWDCDTERDDKCTGDFKETDTIPPPKWRRCFKPRLINGKVDGYDWDTMTCTQKNSAKCCGGVGECIPSAYGGYCRATKKFTEKDKDDKEIGKFKSGEGFIYDVVNGYRIKHNRDEHDVEKSNKNSNNFYYAVQRKNRECKKGEEETINLSDEEIDEQNEEDEEFEEVVIGVVIGTSFIVLIIGYLLYRYSNKGKLSNIKIPIRGANTFLPTTLPTTIPRAPNVKPMVSKTIQYIIAFIIILVFIIFIVVVYIIETDEKPTEEEQRIEQSIIIKIEFLIL